MPEKRFTNIEHDYENAWIKCNDNGDFMIYAIYKELDESLPSLEDLLNGLHEEREQLEKENKELRAKVDDKTVAVEVAISEQMENILKVIDKKLEETEELNGVDTAMYYAQKGVLQDLKKELIGNG